MSDRGTPCVARIGQELERAEQRFATIYRDMAKNPDYERWSEELEPLSIDLTLSMRITLSWGGPSDWLEAELTRLDGRRFEVTSLTYHFADWFDHAERVVTEAEAPALWRLAEYHAESAGDWLVA